jgi:hypothetical protein
MPVDPIGSERSVACAHFAFSCSPAYRNAPVGVSSLAAAGRDGARCCAGGSRARAMAIWQASCEVEIVPSLHSNLAGKASATGAGLSTAACAGAGASAAGCRTPVQAAQQKQINKTATDRIRIASGHTPGAELVG